MHHVFNGIDLLEIVVSLLVGAVFALRTAKITRDYDRMHRSDTPIGDRVAFEMGIRQIIKELD